MNLYDILEISPNASDDVIRSAYKALAKKFHPDNSDIVDEDHMKAINMAYEILIDHNKRATYDYFNQQDTDRLRSSFNTFSKGVNIKQLFYIRDIKCDLVPDSFEIFSRTDSWQVKISFINFFDKSIIAMKGLLRCYDYFSTEYTIEGSAPGFLLQDTNINPYPNHEEITLALGKNNNIKVVSVEIIELVFEDGEKWVQDNPSWVKAVPEEVKPEDRSKYFTLYKNLNKPYKPSKGDNYWSCVCGQFNQLSRTKCSKCNTLIVDCAFNEEELDRKYSERAGENKLFKK